MIAESPCDTDTMTMEVTIAGASVNKLKDEIKLHSLGEGQYQLTSVSSFQNWEIFDVNGRQIQFEQLSETTIEFDLSSAETGIYLLRVEFENSTAELKIYR